MGEHRPGGAKRRGELKVLNSQAWNGDELREGSGLGLVRQRLLRLYPDRHDLDIEHDPDMFLVALRLQVSAAEPVGAAAKASAAPAVSITSP